MSFLRLTCLGSLLVLAACTQSRVPLGTDDGGVRDGGGGVSCGPTTCAPGLVCCNESCGTCTRPGEGCSTLACVHTCGGDECPQGVFACCPGCPGEADFCAGMGGECPPVACPPPPVCFDGTECGEGEICCPGCSGEGFCVDESAGGCPDIACPPPGCFTDADCGAGVCCSDCEGGTFCSAAGTTCPTCPGDECRPMEARGVGFCDAFLGWAWNGMACEPLSGCGCEGADCGALAMDELSCEARFAHCGSRPCASDGECETNEWCNPCAHGSCGGCADCVAACTTSRCATGETATCRQVRPECGSEGTAIVVDGCWLCVDAYTCERFPAGDCRSTGCPDGSTCTACFMSYLCLEEGMACAL